MQCRGQEAVAAPAQAPAPGTSFFLSLHITKRQLHGCFPCVCLFSLPSAEDFRPYSSPACTPHKGALPAKSKSGRCKNAPAFAIMSTCSQYYRLCNIPFRVYLYSKKQLFAIALLRIGMPFSSSRQIPSRSRRLSRRFSGGMPPSPAFLHTKKGGFKGLLF